MEYTKLLGLESKINDLISKKDELMMNTSSINWGDIGFQIFWLVLLAALGLGIYKFIKFKKQNKRFNTN